jgi:hypothetical protein
MVAKHLKNRYGMLFTMLFCCVISVAGCSKKQKNKFEIFVFAKETGGVSFLIGTSGLKTVFGPATLVYNGKEFTGWKALPKVDNQALAKPIFEAGLYVYADQNEAQLLVISERQFIVEKDSAEIIIIEHATGKEFLADHVFEAGEHLFSIQITTVETGTVKDNQ